MASTGQATDSQQHKAISDITWSGEEVLVCSVSDIGPSGKESFKIGNRDIFIVRLEDNFYALDSYCFHEGGPLCNGDIEDLGGKQCVSCPYHGFKVRIATGELVYPYYDPEAPGKPPEWKVGEVSQRTHSVSVRDGKIYVTLSSLETVLDSDMHNPSKY